jgi:hypothetical protein
VPGKAPPAPAPVPGRVRDALLGGTRCLQADRDLAAVIAARWPGAPAAVAEARAFTVRAVTWCARQGIGRYVVPGPGLPPPGAVREAARAVIPDAAVAVACPPGDPSALAYALRDAAALPGVTVVSGDPGTGAGELLASAALRAGGGEAACAALPLMAHLMGAAEARGMIAAVAGALAPGSAVIVSATVPDATAAGDELIAAFDPAGKVFRHDPAVIAGWLAAAGLEVTAPGVTDVRGWRAGWPEPRLRHPRRVPAVTFGAVARVPG